MPFLKRLGFYLGGFSIGIVFLFIFLKKKSEKTGVEFCYLPNCRVLKDLRSKPIAFTKDIHTAMLTEKLDTINISLFLKDADVDFDNSNTKTTPCKSYTLEGLLKEKNAILTFSNCKDSTHLESITYLND